MLPPLRVVLVLSQVLLRDCWADSSVAAPIFFILFGDIANLVFLNLYLAMILDNFTSAVRANRPKLFQADMNRFRRVSVVAAACNVLC